jgi:hypothetical protein
VFDLKNMSEYKLTTELLKLSQSQIWDEAKLEWDLIDVEKVEDSEECLCGHYPILEICTIKNNKTNKESRVGNCCVKKFNNKSDKIFRSIAKTRKNTEKSLNSETLEFAFKNKWIKDWDYKFYMNILRKRKLSEKQMNCKKDINGKIINRLNKSNTNRGSHDLLP